MIVYRNHRELINKFEYIARIGALISNLENAAHADYEDAVSLLIETGELETGITDHFCESIDSILPQTQDCRKMSFLAGSVVCNLWQSDKLNKRDTGMIRSLLLQIESDRLPSLIKRSLPEGFVYYGLYPETFIEAASQFIKECKPQSVVVIGLRSIGTPLSALIAAKLQLMGCEVNTFTVRPRGHPFERKMQISGEMSESLRDLSKSFFAVVDEGPGLSGSSLGGAIEGIQNLGISPEKIVVFPSWIPDGTRFISQTARTLWPKYRKYIGSFEHQWVDSKRLEKGFEKKIKFNFSAGMWRKFVFNSESEYPAVHNHHERRKYLLSDDVEKFSIAKFVGLGRYGKEIVKRGLYLAEAGFTPPVESITNGFMVYAFTEGTPLKSGEAGRDLLTFMAKYCACISKNLEAPLTVPFQMMLEMMEENIEEGLGPQWCRLIEPLKKFPRSLYESDVVAIDGRMSPHEWIRTKNGIVKTDHLEHHADQFFHGCQNIAWDIAGCIAEFRLDSSSRNELIQTYCNLTGDIWLPRRLPFFMTAYLAYRLGYVSLAAESLSGEPDWARFMDQRNFYRVLLEEQLKSK